MIRFKTFLTENKAEKTLDWMKSQKHNEIRSLGALEDHDSYMHTLVSNDPEVRVGGLPIHHAVINRISKIDPHPDKIHTQWLHHTWASGDWKREDEPHVREVLDKFIEHKKRLGNTIVPRTGKKGSDLNSYPSFHDLDRHIDDHINRLQAHDPSKEFSHPNAPLVHDKDGLKVWRLDSKEASQHTRSIFNNKWCTSRNDGHCLYDSYNKSGPLFLVKHKNGEYHQYHFENNEFTDVANKVQHPHELVKSYPELKDVQAFKPHIIGRTDEAFLHDHEKKAKAKEFADRSKPSIFHTEFAIKHGDDSTHEIIHTRYNQETSPSSWKRSINFELSKYTHSPKVINSLIKSDDDDVHRTLAARGYGHETYKDHPDSGVLERVIIHHKDPSHVSHILQHSGVKGMAKLQLHSAAVEYGNDEHRTWLLHHGSTNEIVRSKIAQYGNDEHREHMMGNEEHPNTRANIAFYGNESQARRLTNDKDAYVKYSAHKRLKQLGVKL